jgi:SagB-type dehydrogenase family enzyme
MRAVLMLVLLCTVSAPALGRQDGTREASMGIESIRGRNPIQLPEPSRRGSISLEEAIGRRESVRDFKDEPLTLPEVSQLLWACAGRRVDGVSGASRVFPSAGGVYPLEVYLVAGRVEQVPPGVYRYRWKEHALELFKEGDVRRELAQGAIGQGFIMEAPASIVIAAVYERAERAYGERGRVRYIHMDAGHSSENVYLQASAIGLGTVAVGAFIDERVKKALGLDREEPLYIMPVGRPAGR